MDRQEILDIITNIGTCEDEAQRRQMLDGLRDNINTVFDSNDDLTEQNNNLTAANETLRGVNTDLFLQLGENKSKKEIIESETGTEGEPEKRKFEDLFNEKGELK